MDTADAEEILDRLAAAVARRLAAAEPIGVQSRSETRSADHWRETREALVARGDESARPAFLPIATFNKSSVVAGLRITDSTGRVLEWAPRAIIEWVSWSALVAAGEGVLEDWGLDDSLHPSIVEDLRDLAAAYGQEARAVIARLATELAKPVTRDRLAYHQQLKVLLSDARFAWLIRFVARSWLVLIPSASLPVGPFVTFDVSYAQWLRWGARTAHHEPDYAQVFLPAYLAHPEEWEKLGRYDRWRERGKWWRWRQYMRLGWLETSFVFPAGSFVAARSFSFEVEAPTGLYVTQIDLRYKRLDWKQGNPVSVRAGTAGGGRGRVYAKGDPCGRQPNVWVQTVPAPRTPGSAAALTSTIAAAVLTVALTVVDRTGTSEASAAAAILLTVPTIAVAFLARPEEHEITSSMSVGIRGLLAVTASCLYAAAIAVLLQPAIEVLFFVLLVASFLAWVSCWLITKSYLTPRRFLREASKRRSLAPDPEARPDVDVP